MNFIKILLKIILKLNKNQLKFQNKNFKIIIFYFNKNNKLKNYKQIVDFLI
jgi:hypothetical protein